jgi:hypothetical protein
MKATVACKVAGVYRIALYLCPDSTRISLTYVKSANKFYLKLKVPCRGGRKDPIFFESKLWPTGVEDYRDIDLVGYCNTGFEEMK